MPIALTTKMI